MSKSQSRSVALRSLAGFLALFLIVLLSSVVMNDGYFGYSMDDPYIHLALAENIVRGHYGVNLSEYSAPSSSIIWPYLLVPFTLLGDAVWIPLLLCLLAGLATFYLLVQLLQQWFADAPKVVYVLAAFFALGTNISGVVFTGMEHSLQILCSVLAIMGVFRVERDQKVPAWLYVVLFFGPLVRYENSLISLLAGLYLIMRGYWWQTLLTGLLTVAALGAFSLYLHSLGLGYIASSIMVKSTVVDQSLFMRLTENQLSVGGILMWVALVVLVRTAIKRAEPFQRTMTALTALALTLHFVAGRFGWYGRYELYMVLPVLLVLIYCYKETIKDFIQRPFRHGWMLFYVLLFLLNYGIVLATTPIATNNIYQQQYQMHRFVSEFYPHPVAVNDLGWVSYRNDKYVLDLWGLASLEAFDYRKNAESPQWMTDMANAKQVRLIMIYQNQFWFKEVPQEWQLLAVLRLQGLQATAAHTEVKFFAVNEADVPEIRTALERFSATLPKDVVLDIAR